MALFFTDVEDLLHDTIVRCPPSKVNASTQELLSDWCGGSVAPALHLTGFEKSGRACDKRVYGSPRMLRCMRH